jgi:hypothetical protein
VMRLLEKDPTNRFPDADSLISALEAFRMRVAVDGALLPTRPQKSWAPSDASPTTVQPKSGFAPPVTNRPSIPGVDQQTRRRIALGIGGFLVVVIVLLIFVFGRGK